MMLAEEGNDRNVSSGTDKIKKEDEKRKKIETEVRRRMQCEERAFRIVEKMLENPISEELLQEDAQYISPSHYDDIVEERAIAKMCGYPLCDKHLGNVPKQKYHISTRSNKVYDITARKNFCSNQCYKASQFFSKQLSTAPVWARGEETRTQIKFLPSDNNSGSAGDEVITIATEIRQQVQTLKKLDRYEEKQKEKQNKKKSLHCPDELKVQSLTLSDNTGHTFPTGSDIARQGPTNKGSVPGTDKKLTELVNLESKQRLTTTYKIGSNTNNDTQSGMESKTEGQMEYLTHTDLTDPGIDNSTGSKLNYLHALLDRRKHLLGKMAEIQPMEYPRTETLQSKDMNDKKDSESTHKISAAVKTIPDSDDSEDSGSEKCYTSELKTERKDDRISATLKTSVVEKSDQFSCDSRNIEECVKTQTSEESNSVINVQTKNETSKSEQGQKTVVPQKSVVYIICQTLKHWITNETRDMLTIDDMESLSKEIDKIEFQSKYNELCQRLDHQDNRLDNLVGESEMEEPTAPQNSVPDYRTLKEETQEFTQKVSQFLQGKFVSSGVVKEKKTTDQSEIYLPTVDRHDQMLIRRKIVMEKLDKSMPELLTPLKLTLQDVFSDVRKLVSTFSLSSQNIIFRPAEWTIVSLIILKLLARKHPQVASSFKEESAVRYFDILLTRIGETAATIDKYTCELLQE